MNFLEAKSCKLKAVRIGGGFLLLGVLIYAASLFNGFVEFDDGMLIYDNPIVQEYQIGKAFLSYDPELYIPLTFVSYMVDKFLGHGSPFMFHLSSLILHVINSLLVLYFLTILTKQKKIGLIAGLLFLIHPLHTEAIAWASGKKDLLSALFYLLSLVLYLKYVRSKEKKLFNWTIATYVLGLLSKVSVITLPFALLLIDYKEGRKFKKNVYKEKIPFFVLAVVFLIIALGGKNPNAEAPLIETFLVSIRSFSFYLSKLIVPTNLSVMYPYTKEVSLLNIDIILSALVLIGLIMIIRRFREHRTLVFGLVFFLITLVPTFGNYRKGDDLARIYFASDRYAYLPSVGIILIISLFIWYLWQKRRYVRLLFIILVAIFSMLSMQQSIVWKDTMSLFQKVLADYPDSVIAHNNVGYFHHRNGDYQKAIDHYQKAIEVEETTRTYYNLGVTLAELERWEESLDASKKAVGINPDHERAWVNVGVASVRLGYGTQAIDAFQNAIELDRDNVFAMFNLAMLLDAKGETDLAINYLEEVLRYEPNMQVAREKLSEIIGK